MGFLNRPALKKIRYFLLGVRSQFLDWRCMVLEYRIEWNEARAWRLTVRHIKLTARLQKIQEARGKLR